MAAWGRIAHLAAVIACLQAVAAAGQGQSVPSARASAVPTQQAGPDATASSDQPRPKQDDGAAPGATPDGGTTPAAKPDDAAAKNIATIAPGQTVAILGKKVVGPDGKAVMGPVTDVLVDDDGQPRAAVIDFGGFLGVGSRRVAIDWHSLKFRPGDSDAPLLLSLKPDEIKAAPEYKDPKAPTKVVEPAPQRDQAAPPADPSPEPPASIHAGQ